MIYVKIIAQAHLKSKGRRIFFVRAAEMMRECKKIPSDRSEGECGYAWELFFTAARTA